MSQVPGRRADRGDVDQVSPPMRIALLAVLAFAGLWFVALRPKPPTTPPPAPTPAPKTASGITGAPAKAKAAAAQADAAAKRAEGAKAAPAAKPTPAAKATPSSKPAAKAAPVAPVAKADPATAAATQTPAATAPKPGAAPGDEPSPALRRVLADLDAKRTVVLLFWDGRASDDLEVRRAVRGVDRHDGRVSVRIQDVDRVGEFEPITRGIPVVTSPTVLVIGRDRKARAVTGLTGRAELDELVDRALVGK